MQLACSQHESVCTFLAYMHMFMHGHIHVPADDALPHMQPAAGVYMTCQHVLHGAGN